MASTVKQHGELRGTITTNGNLQGNITAKPTLNGTLFLPQRMDTDPPVYEGEYTIIPAAHEDQILQTAKTYVKENIKVTKIPYAEVSNNSGGTTVTIGNEV